MNTNVTAGPSTGLALDSAPISFEHVTKSYNGRRVLNDISFDIKAGEVTGLLGPNGSGKTTALRCLLGLTRPDSGRCRVDGQAYETLPAPPRSVGVLCEGTGLHPRRTAAEHIALAKASAGLPDPGVVKTHLEQVGLPDAGSMKIREMSQGMRQRLGLALALVGDPHILVLDEPANGLDPEGMEWLRSFLRRFAALGGSVLITSHVLAELQRTIDAVIIIRNGHLAAATTTLPDDLNSFYLSTAKR